MNKLLIKLLSALLVFTVTPVQADEDKLQAVIEMPHRETSMIRDIYRNPLDTLMFFQVKPEHKVVEIWPGGSGWYTEILAPYLREKGQLYIANYDPETNSATRQKRLKSLADKFAANPEIYDKVKWSVFSPANKLDIAPEGTIDRVLTFRNLHNWTSSGEDAMNDIFSHFYKVLKPGGKLGVIDHRLNEDDAKSARDGYVKESMVIEYAKRAGFVLEGKSEINANPDDTKDYEKGVWTLPPSLNLKEKDREKYLAIGESDRMTLLFVKPAAK